MPSASRRSRTPSSDSAVPARRPGLWEGRHFHGLPLALAPAAPACGSRSSENVPLNKKVGRGPQAGSERYPARAKGSPGPASPSVARLVVASSSGPWRPSVSSVTTRPAAVGERFLVTRRGNHAGLWTSRAPKHSIRAGTSRAPCEKRASPRRDCSRECRPLIRLPLRDSPGGMYRGRPPSPRTAAAPRTLHTRDGGERPELASV